MKWVLKTSSIIVGTDDGRAVFRSIDECPAHVRRQMKETLPGPNACRIMITNREALEAIRSRSISAPTMTQEPARCRERQQQGVVLPRWQVMAGLLLGIIASLTALLVWAMKSG